MSKAHILLIIIFLVIFGFKAIKDAQPISKSIEIAGDYVTIRYGNALIKAKLQPEAKRVSGLITVLKIKKEAMVGFG